MCVKQAFQSGGSPSQTQRPLPVVGGQTVIAAAARMPRLAASRSAQGKDPYRSDTGRLLGVPCEAGVTAGLLLKDAVTFLTCELGDRHLVGIRPHLHPGHAREGEVVVPVRMGEGTGLGSEDVDGRGVTLVSQVHHRGHILSPALASPVMHQRDGRTFKRAAQPALVRPERGDIPCVEVVRPGHFVLRSRISQSPGNAEPTGELPPSPPGWAWAHPGKQWPTRRPNTSRSPKAGAAAPSPATAPCCTPSSAGPPPGPKQHRPQHTPPATGPASAP